MKRILMIMTAMAIIAGTMLMSPAASAFGKERLQPVTAAGLTIMANGQTNSIMAGSSDAVTITVAMDVGAYPTNVPVDWWVVASANLSNWYYMNSALQWTEATFSGDFSVFHPVYQGPLFNLSSTAVLSGLTLPPGTYYFWFAVDYPMDGILNPAGLILYDKVTVTVQLGLPPQGLYDSSDPSTAESRSHLDKMAKAGFKLVVNYGVFDHDVTNIMGYADHAAAVGMKVIWDMSSRPYRDGTFDRDYIRERVNAVKAHPATWGYYIADEPDENEHRQVKALSDYVHNLDPAHPRFLVHYYQSADPTVLLRPHVGAADVIALDVYTTAAGDKTPEDMGPVAKAGQELADAKGKEWAIVLQSFDAKPYIDDGRLPKEWSYPGWPDRERMLKERNLALKNSHPAFIFWYSYFDILRSSDPAGHWADLIAAAFGPLNQWNIMTWGGDTLEWSKKLNLTGIRWGCADEPEDCVSEGNDEARRLNVKKYFISMGFEKVDPLILKEYARQYSELSLDNPMLQEITTDDSLLALSYWYEDLRMTPHQVEVLLNEVIDNTKSANPNLKFGVTLYENELRDRDKWFLDDTHFPSNIRKKIDYVHLFINYRSNGPGYAKDVQTAKKLFPNAKIIAGSYNYDRIDRVPFNSDDHVEYWWKKNPKARCTLEQELDYYRKSLEIQARLLKQGVVDWIEFLPGFMGNEEQIDFDYIRSDDSPWGMGCLRPKSEFIKNTKRMNQIALEVLNSELNQR